MMILVRDKSEEITPLKLTLHLCLSDDFDFDQCGLCTNYDSWKSFQISQFQVLSSQICHTNVVSVRSLHFLYYTQHCAQQIQSTKGE